MSWPVMVSPVFGRGNEAVAGYSGSQRIRRIRMGSIDETTPLWRLRGLLSPMAPLRINFEMMQKPYSTLWWEPMQDAVQTREGLELIWPKSQ